LGPSKNLFQRIARALSVLIVSEPGSNLLF
jgi:hypothetical protein